MSKIISSSSLTRRKFLGHVGGASAATVGAGIVGAPALSAPATKIVEATEGRLPAGSRRANRAYHIRHQAAFYQRARPLPNHPTNGDEELYENRIGSYAKALPHNALGEVDTNAYHALVHAIETGKPADFAAIPSGGTVKQANPQAALSFGLEGADSHHLGTPAPPAFNSEVEAGEMAEVYWQALTRDVPYSLYATDPTIAAAVDDLSRFSNLREVNAETIFRGHTRGDLTGPYISQFLWKNVPFGAQTITQQYRVPIAGDDQMTAYQTWLDIQNGMPPATSNQFDSHPRYIRHNRDLAEWDHRDFTYQGFLNAALILLSFGSPALDDANPYQASLNQSGFATFGGPHILDVVARVANCALQAVWYQKWSVHRRLRPEEFGGRVHNHLTGAASYPISPKLLESRALSEAFSRFNSYLLPMAYPEGCPTHPAYPAGHAAIAGACATVLKAFFNESFTVPNPVVTSDHGLSLEPFTETTLTVGGELNKLASNVALGRDAAGVHWRSDGTEGLKLGEAVAVSILKDFQNCFNEEFDGFALTKFDGTSIEI